MKKVTLFALVLSLAVTAKDKVDSYLMKNEDAWKACSVLTIVKPTVEKTETLKNSPDYYANAFAMNLKNNLQASGKFTTIEIVDSDAQVSKSGVIAKCIIHELDGGNAAARFLVGFGAGSSWCEATVECISSIDNSSVVILNDKRGSAAGMKSDEVMENVEEVSGDIAAVLIQLKQ